jgi:hypothetical protein
LKKPLGTFSTAPRVELFDEASVVVAGRDFVAFTVVGVSIGGHVFLRLFKVDIFRLQGSQRKSNCMANFFEKIFDTPKRTPIDNVRGRGYYVVRAYERRNQMGYYKQEEIENQVELGDRVPAPKPASIHVAIQPRPVTRKSIKQQQRELARQATGKFLFGWTDLGLIVFSAFGIGALMVVAMWVNS